MVNHLLKLVTNEKKKIMIKTQTGEGIHIPNRLGIYAHPGEGKTAIMSGLKNSLLIDFEDRSHHHKGDVVNVKEFAIKEGVSELKALSIAIKLIKEQAQKGEKYDYIIFDTMSSFENLIRQRATIVFNKTLIGKSMAEKGTVITDVVSQLPNGGGYIHLHNAYEELLASFDGLANICYIYNCHIKQASKLKSGEELIADDINLTGKLRNSLIQNCQAFAKFYRNNEKKGILSFKQDENNLVSKASSPHLFNKEIIISEMNEKTGEIIYHWDKVFSNK